jgi:HTH-type transcriptional regulator/antitoxin HigA
MKPKLIKTRADHQAALRRIEAIFDAAPGTMEGDELELLSMLVEQYEEKKFPMDPPDPLSAIRFRIEQQGLRARDLVPYLGSPSQVSEILSGQRNLSLFIVRILNEGLGIPAEVLLRKPAAKPDKGVDMPIKALLFLFVILCLMPLPAQAQSQSVLTLTLSFVDPAPPKEPLLLALVFISVN